MIDRSLWIQTLIQEKKRLEAIRIADLFSIDSKRTEIWNVEAAGLLLDYSRNKLDTLTLNYLIKGGLTSLISQRTALFEGKLINTTEDRAILHTFLRDPSSNPIFLKGEDFKRAIHATQIKMEAVSEALRQRTWRGIEVSDIVYLGIGGSYYGSLLGLEALKYHYISDIPIHLIGNVDGESLEQVLKKINPEKTVVIIASKSFTTQEILVNAETIKLWLLAHVKAKEVPKHFLAITANIKKACSWGIDEEAILPFWNEIGGRYSIWSAIGLPLAIALGMENFKLFLKGAYNMDQHFQEAPFEKNMPVLLALISFWHIQFEHLSTQAIIPYADALQTLPFYIQQLEMESNGKRVNQEGRPVTYSTAPILWGSVGTASQHTYHQLLHQGTEIVPVDFIVPLQGRINELRLLSEHQSILVANALAQSQALMMGKTENEIYETLLKEGVDERSAKQLAPHKMLLGDKPSNLIFFEKLTPEILGALLALYEHKVFVQGILWNINSFDQWGVELGKTLSEKFLSNIRKLGNPLTFEKLKGLLKGSRETLE